MKKIFVSGIIIIAFVLYAVIHGKTGDITTPSVSTTSSVGASPSPTAQAASTSQSPTLGTYKDGSYTGAVADAFYGNIQVKAIIQNGKISDVQFLQYPNDRRQSIEINSQAMPLLTSEAIQTQNAQVDIISGATDTSQAFIQSLASALKQAQS